MHEDAVSCRNPTLREAETSEAQGDLDDEMTKMGFTKLKTRVLDQTVYRFIDGRLHVSWDGGFNPSLPAHIAVK